MVGMICCASLLMISSCHAREYLTGFLSLGIGLWSLASSLSLSIRKPFDPDIFDSSRTGLAGLRLGSAELYLLSDAWLSLNRGFLTTTTIRASEGQTPSEGIGRGGEEASRIEIDSLWKRIRRLRYLRCYCCFRSDLRLRVDIS